MLFKVKDVNVKNGLKTTTTISTEDSSLMKYLLSKEKNQPKDAMDAVFNEDFNNKTKKTVINENNKLDTITTLKLEAPKLRDKPKVKKKTNLLRKQITGKAKIDHNTRNLSEVQVTYANNNSFFNKGSKRKQEYENYRRKIEFSSLSEKQKQKLLDQLYKKYQPILKYDSEWVSPMVSGPAKYPQAKMDRIYNSMMNAEKEFYKWWDNVDTVINNSNKPKNKTADKSNEIKAIKESFNNYYQKLLAKNDDVRVKYSMESVLAQNIVLDALKVDTNLYKELFNKLNDVCNYNKNSSFYKTYKEVEKGNVSSEKIQAQKELDNKVIYECADYTISNLKINAGKRIAIKFTFKIKPQLIYALKKRGYTWYSLKECWICRPENFDLEWAKNISKQYDKYL